MCHLKDSAGHRTKDNFISGSSAIRLGSFVLEVHSFFPNHHHVGQKTILWCRSLKHRYFCAKVLYSKQKNLWLLFLTQTHSFRSSENIVVAKRRYIKNRASNFAMPFSHQRWGTGFKRPISNQNFFNSCVKLKDVL